MASSPRAAKTRQITCSSAISGASPGSPKAFRRKKIIQILNQHFTPMARIVNEHHGVVDKYVGDMLMAIFGAPKSYEDDADNAANCARAMILERSGSTSIRG